MGQVKERIRGYVTLLSPPATKFPGEVHESLDRLFQYLSELLYESYLACLGHGETECGQTGGRCVWRHIPAYPPGADSATHRCVPANLGLTDELGPNQPLQLLYPSEAAMTQRVEELFRLHPKAFDTPVGMAQVPLRVRAEAQFLAHALFERRFPDPESRLAAQRGYQEKPPTREEPSEFVLARTTEQWNQRVTEGVAFIADLRQRREALLQERAEVERQIVAAMRDLPVLSELTRTQAEIDERIAQIDRALEDALKKSTPWTKHFLKFVALVGVSFIVYHGFPQLASLSAAATGLGGTVAEYAAQALQAGGRVAAQAVAATGKFLEENVGPRAQAGGRVAAQALAATGKFLEQNVGPRAQALVRDWYPAAGALFDIPRQQFPAATVAQELTAAAGQAIQNVTQNASLTCPQRKSHKRGRTECLTLYYVKRLKGYSFLVPELVAKGYARQTRGGGLEINHRRLQDFLHHAR